MKNNYSILIVTGKTWRSKTNKKIKRNYYSSYQTVKIKSLRCAVINLDSVT